MGTSPGVDESPTLEQIEDHRWGDPPADATRLTKTAHELRRKPLGSMDAEDLRLLLLQQESVDTLVPVALTHLEQNPLAEGDFYPGDLLTAVLKIPQTYWQQHADQRRRTTQHHLETDQHLPRVTPLGPLLPSAQRRAVNQERYDRDFALLGEGTSESGLRIGFKQRLSTAPIARELEHGFGGTTRRPASSPDKGATRGSRPVTSRDRTYSLSIRRTRFRDDPEEPILTGQSADQGV